MYETRTLRCEAFEVIVYSGDLRATVTLPKGQHIRRDYLRGEVIWRLIGGGRDGYYFVASNRWINRMTRTP